VLTLITGRAARVVVGLVISVAFFAATLRLVDLAAVARILAGAAPTGIALAIGFVAVEVALRAARWRLLLLPFRPVPYRQAAGYLCVGYFANTLLPARLGDLARAFLAGRTLGIPRLATLGTIVVERIADGVAILGLVIIGGLAVAGTASVVSSALLLAAVGTAGVFALVGAALAARRLGVHETRQGAAFVAFVRRIAVGAVGLRDPRTLATVIALTLGAFGVAVAGFLAASAAVGAVLTPLQAVVVMGGLALSTSLPAAPGSLGTYEFVGVTIMTSFGITPEAALATALLVHAIVALPPALAGLVTAWLIHFNIREAITAPIAEPPGVLAA
jgi:uncharacterized membrane protein YbhN (UPF0104 family)